MRKANRPEWDRLRVLGAAFILGASEAALGPICYV